jgi:lincosamide nucleotidyltransferase A/C/D/E
VDKIFRQPECAHGVADLCDLVGIDGAGELVMNAADVMEIVSMLEDAGARVWVDGGWGVDALLGEVSRAHSDLDLVISTDDVELARSVLTGVGFSQVLRDWLPTALAVADDKDREVDLHPVTPTPDGGGDQRLPDGETFHYPPPVVGFIAGRQVRCVDVETQVLCHLGYETTDKDRGDMRRLREHFNIELPDPYRTV